jgi:uncharacterized membrane protein YhhN
MIQYYLFPLPLIAVFVVIACIKRNDWMRLDSAGNIEEANRAHFIYGNVKILAQISVIATAILCFSLNKVDNTIFAVLVISGLIVSLVGDIIMYNIKSDRFFFSGLLVFLIALCLYSVAFTLGTKLTPYDLIPGGIMIAVFIALLFYFLPGLKKGHTLSIIVYGLVWCYILARSFTFFYNDQFSITQAILVTAGTITFFYGDLKLAVWKLKKPGISLFETPAVYTIGQTCIALSIAYFPR